MLLSFSCYGEEPSLTQQDYCGNALKECSKLVNAQDTQITDLKAELKELEDKLDKDNNSPSLPWYGYALGGGAVGAAGGLVGAIPGLITGLAVGLILGLAQPR